VKLYQVTTPYLCAGFETTDTGKIIAIAPILRKRIVCWRTIAVFVKEYKEEGE